MICDWIIVSRQILRSILEEERRSINDCIFFPVPPFIYKGFRWPLKCHSIRPTLNSMDSFLPHLMRITHFLLSYFIITLRSSLCATIAFKRESYVKVTCNMMLLQISAILERCCMYFFFAWHLKILKYPLIFGYSLY